MNSNEIYQLFTDLLGVQGVDLLSTGQITDQIRDQIVKIRNLLHPDSAEAACIIYPQTPTELTQVIALASKYQIPILTSDSYLSWGGLVKFSKIGIVVSTIRLHNLIDHAVGDLTVTCEAGIRFRNLQNILVASGQFLAIDSAYSETVTIGEIVNTANTGSFRQRYGGIRDMILGISFVRADGELVKAGGRVVKNVAGYDLMKLLTGAYGTLGVVSQVTFRLYPLPKCDRTVIISGNMDAINTARAKILTSTLTPWAMDIISESILSEFAPQSNQSKTSEVSAFNLIMRFGGLDQVVEAQINKLIEITNNLGLNLNLVESQQTWQHIQNAFFKQSESQIICKIGTLADHAIENLIKISDQMSAQKVRNIALQIHASSGLGILRCEDADRSDRSKILQVRNLLATTGGFLTILEAPVEFKNQLDVGGYAGNAQQVMTALKQKFDPRYLLNPHR
ncbi:FAD/FMN-dependent dehydrogenase [Synechococcus sp. PCC 7502]|uniref:FAD-binding oxidoreductase n=1 Tax=Synechococcus sp. PCC 7502 TaxID=1173263 RepID=UPI00029FABFB|nr:FAD-binding oxidoreductase [Synechococcus sp. PCC 7502]AFY73181.1 FAD/FMN-dependent dehydrogenase [Synechococcus sp. PCC 7502]